MSTGALRLNYFPGTINRMSPLAVCLLLPFPFFLINLGERKEKTQDSQPRARPGGFVKEYWWPSGPSGFMVLMSSHSDSLFLSFNHRVRERRHTIKEPDGRRPGELSIGRKCSPFEASIPETWRSIANGLIVFVLRRRWVIG